MKIYILLGFLCVAIVGISIGWFCDHQDKIRPHGAVAEIWYSQGVKSYEDCQEWAFQDVSHPDGFDPFHSYRTWNHVHGGIFILYGTDYIKESYKRIGRECSKRGL